MRFGKRLTEIIQSGRAHEPYISYKDLKHTIKKVCALIEGGSCSGDSSGDDPALEEHPEQAAINSDASAAASTFCGNGREKSGVEAYQQEFFRLIDINIMQAKTYINSSVATLEAVVGEWQISAVGAGLLYTPQQLAEFGQELAFQSPNQQVLVEWLGKLKSRGCSLEARDKLIRNYNLTATSLNSLQQYIDVNLTAVRKIFKKFEKKVPAKHRTQSVREYHKHHGLMSPAFQQLSASSLHMERLMVDLCAGDACCVEQLVPLSHSAAGSFESALATAGSPASRIDVYAKPIFSTECAFVGGAAAASCSSGPLVASAAAPAAPGALASRGPVASAIPVGIGPVAVGCQGGGTVDLTPGHAAPATVRRPSIPGAREQPPSKSRGKGAGPTAEGAVPIPKSKAGHGRPGGAGREQEAEGGGTARSGRKRGGRGGRSGRQNAEPNRNGVQPPQAPAYPQQAAPSEVGGRCVNAMVQHVGMGVGNVGFPMGMPQGSGCAVNWLAMMPVMQWPANAGIMSPESCAQHAPLQPAPEGRSADV